MAKIYKSTVRQEVWFIVKIDANKKKVASAQIGRKLLPQNITATGNSYEQQQSGFTRLYKTDIL
jgi:hypothetical protein